MSLDGRPAMRGGERAHDAAAHVPHPSPMALTAESVRCAVARPIPTIAGAIVVAIVCVIVLLTTGKTAAAERQATDRLDQMGTRLIAVSDNAGSAGIAAASLTAIDTMPQVEWALGLGPVSDSHNAFLPVDGTGVATRNVYGDLRRAVRLTAGRWPAPGEALASVKAAATLGLGDRVGGAMTITGHDSVSIVGTFQADAALRGLDEAVIVAATPSQGETILYLYAQAASASTVDQIVATLPKVLTTASPDAVTVETPQALRQARDAIASDLSTSSRFLMLATLGVGLVLVAITMLAAVTDRRRDFGRRRALGATRSAIIVMVVAQAIIAAVAGTAVGVGAGLAAAVGSGGAVPPAEFVAGLAVLAILATVVAAVPPAFLAARREPVKILRVP